MNVVKWGLEAHDALMRFFGTKRTRDQRDHTPSSGARQPEFAEAPVLGFEYAFGGGRVAIGWLAELAQACR